MIGKITEFKQMSEDMIEDLYTKSLSYENPNGCIDWELILNTQKVSLDFIEKHYNQFGPAVIGKYIKTFLDNHKEIREYI